MTALLSALVATTRPDSPGPAGTMLQQSPGYVAGWGTLALINAGLAQGKNRSGLVEPRRLCYNVKCGWVGAAAPPGTPVLREGLRT